MNDQSTSTPETVKCPHCREVITPAFVATVPPEQTMTMTLKTQSKYLAADIIGEVIQVHSKVLKDVAACIGTKVCVFISRIDLNDGEMTVEFFVTTVRAPSEVAD